MIICILKRILPQERWMTLEGIILVWKCGVHCSSLMYVQLARPRNTVFLDAQILFQRPKKYERMIILVWNCGRSVASCLAPPLIICCSNSHVSAQTTNDWKDIPVSPTLNFSLCSSQVACFDMYFYAKKIVLKRLSSFLKVWLAMSQASLTVVFFS